MTDPDTWHRRQLETAEELLDEGQAALQRGDLPSALDVVDEALVILDMARAERLDDDVRQLRARALNDRGLLHQQSEEIDRARTLHGRAVELVDDIDEIDEEFAPSAAAVYLNHGQIALFDEDHDTAREATERAMDLVEDLRDRDVQGTASMALSVYQNKTALESYAQNFEEAADAADQAISIAEEIAESGDPTGLARAARVAQQLSVQLFEHDRVDEALEWGERAETFSERAFQHLGDEVVHLYVVSQINLISYYEEQHRFADAEDCLWKAIDVAGADAELLERGQAFYENCRKFADERLEEGNLPRDEVEMGYEELQEMMDEHGIGSP